MRLPPATRRRLLRLARPAPPRILRPQRPRSECWGYDRGTPVDRYFIESWLERHREDVRGRVLEVKDDGYTTRFGGDRVSRVDVLDIDPANEHATITADLAHADVIPDAMFDCVLLTQTLQLVYDVSSAISHVRRVLAPGGVALVTVPSVSPVVLENRPSVDYWRFTRASCERLFEDCFGAGNVDVTEFGNLVACTSFLAGLASEELTAAELEAFDERFPLLIAVRAVTE